MTAQGSKRERKTARFRNGLLGKHPSSDSAPVILSKLALCFGKRFSISMPHQMEQLTDTPDAHMFIEKDTGLILRLMCIPFRAPLHRITETDLQVTFRKVMSVSHLPDVNYGFLKYSPTLTAVWQHPAAQKQFMRGNVEVTLKRGEEKTILHLIQVRRMVYLVMFTNVTPQTEDKAYAMLYSVSVDTKEA
ncbi:MAG: hypothetical protein MJ071_01680 [Oscillospiraceae bacterium]|nr:hypothetical protein [Oscillospiraceae bacterium]